MGFTTYLKGNLLLFKFFFCHLSTIRSLPVWMRNPDSLKDLFEKKKKEDSDQIIKLSLPVNTAIRYNSAVESLKSELRQLHAGDKDNVSYRTQLLLLFLLRLACIGSAWAGNIKLTAVFSLAQFLVAPYSLFVSFALAIALIPPLYASHYFVYYGISCVGSLLVRIFPAVANLLGWLEVPISPAFIILFFLVDQAICLYCHYLTPSKEFTARETWTHVLWGFLNTKTYHVVLLLHLMNAQLTLPIWIWLCDAALSLTPLAAENISRMWMHWLELFYHQHRMAHLPKVYEHAHKLHHYLHGTNAFDAHIYGNGMPEEFFFMIIELGFGLFLRQSPASLNRFILQHSLDNKFGHTQKPQDTCGENFHADHHLLHVKNFGIYNCLMDMYFSTANFSDRYMIKPTLYHKGDQNLVYSVQKETLQDKVEFTFTPAAQL